MLHVSVCFEAHTHIYCPTTDLTQYVGDQVHHCNWLRESYLHPQSQPMLFLLTVVFLCVSSSFIVTRTYSSFLHIILSQLEQRWSSKTQLQHEWFLIIQFLCDGCFIVKNYYCSL
jgi:hypothetical protein